MTIQIESIFVGRPQRFYSEDASKIWDSAIIKRQVAGPVRVARTNLDGDQQADLVHHGGPDKAVLAYPATHYDCWRQFYPEIEWSAGCFGENLSISNATELDCCIGDVYQVADCVLQVSQPRQPCWKLARRWNVSNLAVQVQKTRRTGWYLRVLQEGTIASGAAMILLERPHPELTVEWANQVMFAKPRIKANDFHLASCPLLSESWRTNLQSRSANDCALVLRTWRAKPIEADSVGSVYRLEGCDLLLRPDLFRKYQQISGNLLKYVLRQSCHE